MLIVGLGNPGPKYAGNRHNVGFMVIDAFAEHLGIKKSDWKSKFSAAYSIASNSNLVLLKPQTYMNLSGRSVRGAASFHKLNPAQICVVHDELDLPAGTVKLKFGGGFAGHNGLKSIGADLGTPDFVRLRIGIGIPNFNINSNNLSSNADKDADLVHSWVLGNFSSAESDNLQTSIESAILALEMWLKDGLEAASTKVNRKLK